MFSGSPPPAGGWGDSLCEALGGSQPCGWSVFLPPTPETRVLHTMWPRHSLTPAEARPGGLPGDRCCRPQWSPGCLPFSGNIFCSPRLDPTPGWEEGWSLRRGGMCFVSSSFPFFLSFFSSSQQGRLQGALASTSHETCLPSPVGSALVFCGITFPAPDAASTLLSLNVTVALCTSPTNSLK